MRLWFGASDYAHDELAIHGSNEEHEEEEHEHEEEEHEEEGFEIGSTFTNKQQEGRMEVQHMPVASRYGPLRGTVGIHWDHADTTGLSFEGDSLLEPANTESFAGFWFEELQASDRLRLQAALRLEGTSVDGTGFSSIEDPEAPVLFSRERSFAPLSGGIGALYDIGNNVTFMLNGQAVERAPAAAELFSKGMHEATGTFEIGNPFLLEEKAQTLEAGLKRAAGRFRFDANAYYTRYDGFIYRQLTGLVCGVTLDSCHSEDGEDRRRSTDTNSIRCYSCSAMQRSTEPNCLANMMWRRYGAAHGASKANTTSCALALTRAETCRASRRTGWAAASITKTTSGSRARRSCMHSSRTTWRRTNSPHRVTHCLPQT